MSSPTSDTNDPKIPTWPPSAGLGTHLVTRSQTTFAMSGSSIINAPASTVWSFIRDTSTYSTWNSFTPRAHITSQPPPPSSSPTTTSSSSPPSAKDEPPPFEGPVKDSHSGSPQAHLSPILQKSTRFTFDVLLHPHTHPNSTTPTPLRVTDVSTPSTPSDYIPQDILASDGSFWPDLDSVYRISWTTEGKVVSLGLRGERVTEIVALSGPVSGSAGGNTDADGDGAGAGAGDGDTAASTSTSAKASVSARCMYRTWECQTGPIARVVKWKYGQTLRERFEEHAGDVKREAERRWASEQGGQ